MTSCASVSLMEEFIGITLLVEPALSPSPPRALNRRLAGRSRSTYRSIHRHHFTRGRARETPGGGRQVFGAVAKSDTDNRRH